MACPECEHGCTHPSTSIDSERWQCHECGTVVTRASLPARLEALAAQLRADNPTYTVVVDQNVVWLRGDGMDWGIYSTTIDYRIVCVYENGVTTIHRPTPVG